MKKICMILLLTLTSCSLKSFCSDTVESDDDEKEYWKRIEECGFKFPES